MSVNSIRQRARMAPCFFCERQYIADVGFRNADTRVRQTLLWPEVRLLIEEFRPFSRIDLFLEIGVLSTYR
jgi:hypothetical protein